MNDKSENTAVGKKLWFIIVAAILVVCVAVGGIIFGISSNDRYSSFKGSVLNAEKFTPVTIAEGLQVTSMGGYSGLFLEDGSDDVLSSVLMIVLENTSDKDLQLVRIKAVYTDFIAEFEATNIPAGKRVVLLEKNRREYPSDSYIELRAENVVFFSENMSIMEDTIEVVFGDGFVELKNIGDKDIEGTTYIYYKNRAGDTLYGGITYRANSEETIPCGGSIRIITQHCTQKNTEIMQIVNVN